MPAPSTKFCFRLPTNQHQGLEHENKGFSHTRNHRSTAKGPPLAVFEVAPAYPGSAAKWAGNFFTSLQQPPAPGFRSQMGLGKFSRLQSLFRRLAGYSRSKVWVSRVSVTHDSFSVSWLGYVHPVPDFYIGYRTGPCDVLTIGNVGVSGPRRLGDCPCLNVA